MDVELKILPLYHCICLMWAHSAYYGTNPRMMVFFRMINNLMIEQSAKSLDPATLFHGEPDESLTKLKKIIAILELYRTSFKTYRDKLPQFVPPGKNPILWSFKVQDVFDRFDLYMKRLYLIREIFDTAAEFWKLQKIEIGGIKGRQLTSSLMDINDKFQALYQTWSNIKFDPLDPDPTVKHFENERKKYRDQADTMERKIATILSQAFEECFTIESTVKLIVIAGSLVHRRIVLPEIAEKVNRMLDFYTVDLRLAKDSFEEQMELFKKHGVTGLIVDQGFPPVAGALFYIRKWRARLGKPIDELPNISLP